MDRHTLKLTCNSVEETAHFAARLSGVLSQGDTVLLSGPIGAGKSLLCRHIIQNLLQEPEDIPSPTFTLVQTYEVPGGEIWHSDLYRLGGPSEIDELGLFDAFEYAICLVEWPDRLGNDAPEHALWLEIDPDRALPETRHITLHWTNPKWQIRMENLTHE